MSVSFIIRSIETNVNSNRFDISDEINNLKNILITEFPVSIPYDELRNEILYLWNIAVKLSMVLKSDISDGDKMTLKMYVIPEIREFVVDVLRIYIGNDKYDKYLLFYCSVHAYKAFIDCENYDKAERIYDDALKQFKIIDKEKESIQTFVQLIIWKSDYLLGKFDSDAAFQLIQYFLDEYNIESSFLVSYMYEKSADLKSIKWCKICLSQVEKTDELKEKWYEKIISLLVQLFLNSNQIQEAKSYVNKLPESLIKYYLDLKCCILSDEPKKKLEKMLFEFISKSNSDFMLLVALCYFISDNYDKLGQIAVNFINEVNKIKDISLELQKHIWISTINIFCKSNDINQISCFLDKIHDLTNDESKDIASIFWNKALEKFDENNYQNAAQWMRFSRKFIFNEDYKAQSKCYRFIARCMVETQEFSTALSFIEESTLRDPESEFNYLMKFRILKSLKNDNEANKLVQDLLNSSPYLEKFSIYFFTSLSAELYEYNNLQLSLQVLLTIFDLKINIPTEIYKNVIISTFSIIQSIDDDNVSYKCFQIIAEHWDQSIEFDQSYYTAFFGLAYSCGISFTNKGKFEKAAMCFLNGSKFSGDTITNIKIQCIFKSVENFLKIKNEEGIQKANNIIQEYFSILDISAQNHKDLFTLCKIELLICLKSKIEEIINLIDEITTADVIQEITSFICDHETPLEIIKSILDRAEKISENNEAMLSIYHQFINKSGNVSDIKIIYEQILKYIQNNSKHLNSNQIQFFMAYAWNIGVQVSKSQRIKEGEWWLSISIKIMKTNKDLIDIYSKNMEDGYLTYMKQINSRLLFNI